MGLSQPQGVIFDNHGLFWKAEWFVSWSRPEDLAITEQKTA